ncbi:MAG: hypothetical protein EA347_10375 [Thioalkalivibrio sp.]|nr:MAG: hypothetical protein EA347_10375 [Thioalkalivibrio sp.]
MDAPFGNRHGMCRWLFLLAMAVCLATLGLAASAQDGTGATDWLFERQQGDGRIAADADETTPHHATFEAARALHGAHAGSAEWLSALAFIDSRPWSGFPWLPRRLFAAGLAGDPRDDLRAELLLRQNPDGGFAADPGDQSSVLDTVEALEALGAAGLHDGHVLQPAIAFLLARQNDQGGVSPNPASPASLYLTARMAGALQRYQFEYGLSGPLGAATDFLWSELEASGPDMSWQETQALLALIPSTLDSARYQSPLDALRASQSADGSWGGSVYATALALRALQTAEAAGSMIDPQLAAVGGRVVDALQEAPVAGASITLAGGEDGGITESASDGRFLLGELQPGDYTLQIAATGFQALTRQVELKPGSLLDMGLVNIAIESDTALIAGVVTDAETGEGLTAEITVIGGSVAGATAAADGSYVLPVPAGELQLSVTASGYHEARAVAVVDPGERLVFSPALGRDSADEPDAPVEVTGRLLDADTLLPIPGAAVQVPGTDASTVSDTGGVFVLSGLAAGEIRLEVVHASYRTAVTSLLATPGARIDLGDLPLQPQESAGTTLRGQVVDAYTGEPLAGARVHAGGQVVETDGQGEYEIGHIEELSFEVRVSATGYRSALRALTLQQPGRVRLDFALERTGLEGIRIAGVIAHAQTVGAFEEARFTVGLENESDDERRVVLAATVEGVDSAFLEDFLIPLPDADRGGAFPLAPGESVLREFGWFTRHLEPGTYRVRTQAWSADGARLFAEAETAVTVSETLYVASLEIVPEPREVVRGEMAGVALEALVRNGSNVASVLEFSLALRDPDGHAVHEREVRLELPPSAAALGFDLAAFDYRFEQAGTHAVEITNLAGVPVGALDAGRIEVAPNIRIQGSHGVEPEQILPLEDAGVRIRLTIEGMEDGQ